ncbi:mannose-1-phosphate guanylyltransferase [Aquimarina sp. ERC-38]|uniref:mannose-1-phosphate guanylyltransferase n=1 Tax=Aquimarina sp. ERC-38 TaxID=2949996 RepID=UPI00224549C0|nr:mannose-1-phosphate guanylyltransferase [Aquimarina sp. ERC-38]UZO82445.1 mannose-1-phosphate guanylyltransferase [Aquimarina sp. ERC-38]
MRQTDKYAIIMAGGVGSRFWPMSTSEFPKQFHDMLGTGDTLIQHTFKRLNHSVPTENIYILTNERYDQLVLEQLPEISKEQVITEPAMRNTAPCILYASLKIQKQNPNAVMVVAPSDHWIEDEAAFTDNLEQCFTACAESDILMTLGITPTFANTGYGYIQYDKSEEVVKKVMQFTEKPDYATAKSFLKQGNYLWNAGIFIWSVSSITAAFEEYQKDMTHLFKKGNLVYNTEGEADFITQHYPKADNISIDYAILEKATNVYVKPAGFDWNDLGTWGSLYDKLDKTEESNAVVNARVLCEDACGNMIRTKANKIVVVDGLQDYIIVDKDEVLLIYPKKKEQDIKQVLKKVTEEYGAEFG